MPELPLEKTPPEQESKKSMVKIPVPLPWLALVACVLASSIPENEKAGDLGSFPRIERSGKESSVCVEHRKQWVHLTVTSSVETDTIDWRGAE